MSKRLTIKNVFSLFTLQRIRKLLPSSARSVLALRLYRWWNEQLTYTGRPVFFIWLLICIPSTFQVGRPAFYICLALGMIIFLNYMIAYFFINLKVNVIRNHTLSTHAGGSIIGYVELTNNGYSNLKDIEIFERVLPTGFSQSTIPFISDIKKKTAIQIPFALLAQTRGEYLLRSIVVATSYPFGLIRKIKVKKMPQIVIIYPQLLPLEMPKYYQGISNAQNLQSKSYSIEQNEYLGNREYSYGDQTVNIDHKAWGRIGSPVTKIYQNDHDVSIGVVFIPDYLNIFEEENFENSIKITASIIHAQLLQKNNPAFYMATESSPEMIPEVTDPDIVYNLLALSKKKKIDLLILQETLQNFSGNLNYLYIIGTSHLIYYKEALVKALPEDMNINLIICSNQKNDFPLSFPSNYNCIVLNDQNLKQEVILLA